MRLKKNKKLKGKRKSDLSDIIILNKCKVINNKSGNKYGIYNKFHYAVKILTFHLFLI